MKLSPFNKTVWLWLREHPGYWTSQEVAQRTGDDPHRVYRALHNMTRIDLVEIVPPAIGASRKRYGVTEACLAPTGMTVGEVTTGKSAQRPAEDIDWSRAVAHSATNSGGLSRAERAYLRAETRFESGLA